ncbi:MAG TPA: hypothetical protein VHG71_12185 [Verrucomicrobiae bacterium]|nr:hypothetical protein [Verrucomicrobiae bacterium]
MRTKALLLTAVALAVGLASSEAQNVYSQNIVGYINYTSTTVSPQFELISNPLDNGSNTVSSLFKTPPGGTQLQLWQPSSGSFLTVSFTGGHWKTNGVTVDNTLIIQPGTGFFISVGSGVYSNTFVGNVTPASGTAGTNVIETGFQAVSSLVPYSDNVTNTSTLNLIVPGGTQVQAWNVVNQSFDVYSFTGGRWRLNGNPANLTLGVPQGVFVNNQSGAPINWVETGP